MRNQLTFKITSGLIIIALLSFLLLCGWKIYDRQESQMYRLDLKPNNLKQSVNAPENITSVEVNQQ